MALRSPAFSEGEPIPKEFTCDGRGVPPPLTWEGLPRRTRSLVVWMDTPWGARGPEVHWLVYGLSPAPASLRLAPGDGGVPTASLVTAPGDGGVATASPVTAATQPRGHTSFGARPYRPPCPAPGEARRYRFRLLALDETPAIDKNATAAQVWEKVAPHLLAESILTGRYRRPPTARPPGPPRAAPSH